MLCNCVVICSMSTFTHSCSDLDQWCSTLVIWQPSPVHVHSIRSDYSRTVKMKSNLKLWMVCKCLVVLIDWSTGSNSMFLANIDWSRGRNFTFVAHIDWSRGWNSLKQNPPFLEGLSMRRHVFSRTVPTQWLDWKRERYIIVWIYTWQKHEILKNSQGHHPSPNLSNDRPPAHQI